MAIAGLSLQAQAPANYYDSATGKTGDELKVALHNIIKDHTTISYKQIWSAFWSTDNKGNNVVWDMYSDGANYSYSYYNNNHQCGEYEQEGDCFNREHSWPKSWFSGNEQTIPGRDLHHIFPTDGFVNAQRSSFPYGEVQNATWTSQNGSKLGPCKSSLGYTGTVFEPIDEYKGDFARALMYMSVRYYSEDDDWGTSGMTNKSVIKPWAIAMLLNWSDNDPVSQKEIDRNNVVYGIQGNRNPFIDHPEYAHIIWEEDWTGVTYNISCATVNHGSISAPLTAVEGTMVTLTATPAQGYMLGSWNVYKTGDANTTVPVSGNTFTMPSFNVTVSATFTQNTTAYTITTATGLAHGSISASVGSAQSGTTITLSNTPASGYVLYSYYVYKTGDVNTIVYSGTSSTFVMPAYNVTVSASFVQPSSYTYIKVTEAPTDWSGDYLIVNEGNNKAFNGSLSTLDANNNTLSVTISNNSIGSSSEVDAAIFTMATTTGGYSIKAANGKYIGYSGSSSGLTASNTALTNTISLSQESIIITGTGTSTLQYNKSADRFRYYSTSQQPIQLYKKTGNASTPTHTIQFNPNGSSQSSYSQTVNEFESTALQTNTFTRDDYAFDSWNTAADGTGTTYFDGAVVTLLNDLTLYAQWKPLFSITLASVEHGSITVSHNQAVEGDIVTLTATPNSGYEFDSWAVTDASSNPITVTENQFEMPASNVTVSATFLQPSTPSVTQYVKVATAPDDWSGEYILVYENNATSAFVWTGVDAKNCYDEKAIVDNTIEEADFVTLTIASMSGGYSIKVNGGTNNGKYISGASGSNTISFGTTAAANTIELEINSVTITSNRVMRFNNASSDMRFRYYTAGTQQPVQLYKKISGTTPDPETPFEVSYHLVTSTDQLVAGRTYLIVNSGKTKALGTTQNTNYRASVNVSVNSDIIESIESTVCELTLGGSIGQWTFKDGSNGFLYAPGGGNYLRTQATNSTNGQWSITVSNGVASIVSNANIDQKYLKYNNNDYFSCYKSTSGGVSDVCLFIRSEEIPITQNTTEANIFPFDKHIVQSGTILTVTGTVTCNDPANLIIEDGAQFIHHNDGVKATVKKNVEGYTDEGGWYTIATPFTAYTPNAEIISGEYDLYAYDEDGEKEWINYKSHTQDFTMTSGDGYLYAHYPATTLSMTGTLNSGDFTKTVNLSYNNSHETIKGFNLLGNPTAHNITFTKTENVADGYYYLYNSESWEYETGNSVPVGRGFLVKANATGQSVTLNQQSKDNNNSKDHYLCINIDGEKAYLKLDEGVSMPLLTFRGKTSSLWLESEGQQYIMLVRDGAESIELNYKAHRHGSHNLSIDAKALDLDYLHLVDRLTGNDIDLLQTPNYSFESKSSDYPSRFQLVFNPKALCEPDVFAYYVEGRIVVSGINEPYEIQVVDVTGRLVNDLIPGVYVIRLITPDKVRTQKLLVN